jgi:hypothetical protein
LNKVFWIFVSINLQIVWLQKRADRHPGTFFDMKPKKLFKIGHEAWQTAIRFLHGLRKREADRRVKPVH